MNNEEVPKLESAPLFKFTSTLLNSGLVNVPKEPASGDQMLLRRLSLSGREASLAVTATSEFSEAILADLRDYATYNNDPLRSTEDRRFVLNPEAVVRQVLFRNTDDNGSVQMHLQNAGLTVDEIDKLGEQMAGKVKNVMDAVRKIPVIARMMSGSFSMRDERYFSDEVRRALKIQKEDSEKRGDPSDPKNLPMLEKDYIQLVSGFFEALNGKAFINVMDTGHGLFRFKAEKIDFKF